VVSHELASIFTIADNSIFLDPITRTLRASGNPRELLRHSTDRVVRQFLARGEASMQTNHTLNYLQTP
jgi:phospholipid/cholesterol/gamma-HCH transport system ATP-binding protein